MIYIDPSELKEQSQLLRYLSDVVYKPLPGLEALTGADVMISPSQCPSPLSDDLILANIASGATLIQIKFGHDLPASILDDRLKDAQSKMIATGASAWQICLLFIGLIGYDDTKGMATINGQLTYGDHPMKWTNLDACRLHWIGRKGNIYDLPSGNRISDHFRTRQAILDLYQTKEARIYFPKQAEFYDDAESDNPALRKWNIGQKLIRVDDFRVLLCAIPGARIGPEKATAIMEWMQENEIRLDFNNFLGVLRQGWLTQVPGIGPKTIEAVQWGLFRTYEERQNRSK